MPIIKSAIKKLRKDRKLEKVNDIKRAAFKKAIKIAEKSKKSTDVSAAISLIDKAVKRHLLHANKAARLKSRLSKLLKTAKSVKAPAAKTTATKKTTIKSPKKKKTSA